MNISIWAIGSDNIKGRGSQDGNLDLCNQVVKMREGWVEQKL